MVVYFLGKSYRNLCRVVIDVAAYFVVVGQVEIIKFLGLFKAHEINSAILKARSIFIKSHLVGFRVLYTMMSEQNSEWRLLYGIINRLNFLHVDVVDGTIHMKFVSLVKYFHLFLRCAIISLVLGARNKSNVNHAEVYAIITAFNFEICHVA